MDLQVPLHLVSPYPCMHVIDIVQLNRILLFVLINWDYILPECREVDL
jgi:hypothetical protein